MPGPTAKSKTERQERMAQVAKLDRQGVHQHEIARTVGISQPMVCMTLKKIRQQYVASQQADYAEKVAQRVEQLRGVMVEAWEAFERSKEDAVATTVEREPRASGGEPAGDGVADGMPGGEELKVVRIVTTTEQRVGSCEYLQVMRQCIMDIARLEGLLDDTVVNNNTQVNVNQGGARVALYLPDNGRDRAPFDPATEVICWDTLHARAVGPPAEVLVPLAGGRHA